MQSTKAKNGFIETDIGTQIGFYYNDKHGKSHHVNIVRDGPRGNYAALFVEDDVDFYIRVKNGNKEERDFRFQLGIYENKYGFVVRKGADSKLKTVVDNGGHFHFVAAKNEKGKQLLGAMSNQLHITPDAALNVMDNIRMNVAYSPAPSIEIKVKCKFVDSVYDECS